MAKIWAQKSTISDIGPGLPLGGRTPYITSKNWLGTPKLHIKDVRPTSENSLVRPKLVIQKKTRPHLPDYVIYVPPSNWKLIDHARTSHLTDFKSFIDRQCHV